MNLNRKQFLCLTAAMAAGCATEKQSGNAGRVQGSRLADAGPAGNFASEGVYPDFRKQGFFVVRRGGRLFALSSICTHRRCELKAEPDHTFYCPCHGSTFDPDGKVTEGPATRDLPLFETYRDDQGHLRVRLTA